MHWNQSASGRVLAVAAGVNTRRRYNSPLRAEQANETRRRVLAAARELFVADGYRGTTVAAVAAAAGVSPDTIYASLGGKRGLLERVVAHAREDPDDPAQRVQQRRREEIHGLTDHHERLRRLIGLSCETLARISPVHAVIKGAADGDPFAAGLLADMLDRRLEIQSRNVATYLGAGLRDGLSPDDAAERYSALLSPDLYNLLTVDRGWPADRFEAWVAELLDRDLLA
jgi:AcrR family transcriptional regulator